MKKNIYPIFGFFCTFFAKESIEMFLLKKNGPLRGNDIMKPSSGQEKNGARSKERRSFSRKAHSGSIFFATQKRFFEGELLNYSQAGLGVRVPEKLAEGENLVVAVPFDGATPAKRPAKVVWSNGRGFGAKFMR